MSDAPLFRHDCDVCTFLGRYMEGTRTVDLYYCQNGPGPTVTARYGDEGPDYTSGLSFADLIPAIGEARRRAKEQGLLP